MPDGKQIVSYRGWKNRMNNGTWTKKEGGPLIDFRPDTDWGAADAAYSRRTSPPMKSCAVEYCRIE